MKNLMGNFALKLSLIEILLLGSYFVPYFCNNWHLLHGCIVCLFLFYSLRRGSVAEWLACWTQAQKGLGSNRSRDAVG